jgi:hypothetical protein
MSFYREISGFYRICKGDSLDLRPQDDRERFVDKHQKKSSLVCHPAADEESPNSTQFLIPMYLFYLK